MKQYILKIANNPHLTEEQLATELLRIEQEINTENIIRVHIEEDNDTTPRLNMNSYQRQVDEWIIACFGKEIRDDKRERNWRLIEEALELVQSLDIRKIDVQRLVDYVFERPKGEPKQEVGGVMTTLNALCNANDLNVAGCGIEELKRCWSLIEKIRLKQQAKQKNGLSPLP